jgi:hypothetical protein
MKPLSELRVELDLAHACALAAYDDYFAFAREMLGFLEPMGIHRENYDFARGQRLLARIHQAEAAFLVVVSQIRRHLDPPAEIEP